MSVKSKDELLKSLKTVIGDNTSDEVLTLIEDITDTLDNSTGSSSEEDKKKIQELENKVKETDEMWRKKYTDRFFNPDTNKPSDDTDDGTDDGEDDGDDNSPQTFNDLFATE